MRNRPFMKRDNRWRERPGSATIRTRRITKAGPVPDRTSALFCNRISVKRRRDFGSPLGSQSEIPVTQAAILVLEDGTVFEGESVGAPGLSVGEVVFNTAMTGYQEVLTDPSYARQMVTLTYPHIGNTGMTDQDNEASKVWSAGLIVRDVPRRPSNWRSQVSLQDWLIQRGVVAIAGIDTRKLTRILREKGAQNGALMAGDIDVEKALEAARKFPGLKGMDLAKVVTTEKTYTWTEGQLDLNANAFVSVPAKYKVVAYDFGVKTNILRMLAERG